MTEITQAELGEALPQLLLSLMERRYLGDFQPARWRLAPHPDDAARPVLSEVLGLGRPRPGEEIAAAMPYVLTASHWHGQAVVLTVHGDGTRHRIFVGGRRIAGTARGSTEDFIQAQAGLLGAHVPGLVLGEAAPLDGSGFPELSSFLGSAPALAAISGIPSVRHGPAGSAAFQNLDRLIGTVGRRRYALMVVAEPLGPADLDDTLARCTRLKSEIHSLVSQSVTHTAGENTQVSTTTIEAGPAARPASLMMGLYGLAAFCAAAGMLDPAASRNLGVLGALINPANSMVRLLPALLGGGERTNVTHSHGENRSTAQAVHLLDAGAERCRALLQHHIDRLTTARGKGWWRTSVYVAADSEGTLESVAAALRGICSGDVSTLDPMRVIRLPTWALRQVIARGQSLTLSAAEGGDGHPFGPAYDSLATCMTSDELAVLVSLPRRDVPGLPIRDVGEFALSAPPPTRRAVTLGGLLAPDNRELQPVTLTGEGLNRHVFISGMTGYGKTTTAKNLLIEAYTRLEVPFLVIEPVKAEYRSLAAHPALRGRLKVFTVGGDSHLPLRLNPFVPVGSVPLARHIDLLKAVFNAAFPMFAGMPYVLEEAMIDIYTERGWNLYTSVNDLLGPRPSAEDLNALVPSIGDLHDKIDEVLDRKQYGREVHQNMGAALRSRLRSLMVGTKGLALDTRRTIPAHDLFDAPAVIELRNLGDDEEKAFVMALLLCQLYEYAESRVGEARGERLRHLTLIEEAHRLLRAPRSAPGMETADSQAKAVSMFTDMLAEMRSYGEGFIVADQIPTKLAPETVKNSNVKILHRLVSAEDRAVVGAALGLTEAQSRHLATLPPGEAIVHDERIGSAVLVRMTDSERAGQPARPPEPVAARRAGLSYLHRNGGCRHCPAPCEYLFRTGHLADAEFEPFFLRVLLSDAEQAWAEWSRLAGGSTDAGVLYCAVTQAAYRWLGRYLAERDGVPAASGADAARTHGDRMLRQDRGAREFARLAARWREAGALGDAERTCFAEAKGALQSAVADRPIRELPGCANCPARCLMPGFVAPQLPRIGQQVVGRVTLTAHSAEARSRNVRRLGPDLGPVWTALGSDGERDALLHCLVTMACEEVADDEVDAVLAALPGGHDDEANQNRRRQAV
ncbi:DUF87 domain-containing protein [Microbispora sp. NBC_01189]|uniref:ATP-binding protein n=1 Tax=Microbispora sp. NBC_01189 TaxID=2903583 RepID=UPI002E11300C|nr:DUF87 domain-containing protein [Microbispora sp. NBC_01189]